MLPGKTPSWYCNERHHSKGPVDGIEVTVKNVIFRKDKFGELVEYSPLEFSEAVTKVLSSIHFVYLPENKNIVEPEDLSKARKIDQPLCIRKLES